MDHSSMTINMTCMKMNFTRSMMKERFQEDFQGKAVAFQEAVFLEEDQAGDSQAADQVVAFREVTQAVVFQVVIQAADSREAERQPQHLHRLFLRKRRHLHLPSILEQSEDACTALRMCG
jgi:nanoRNase/pAp phosphatase (c-di-AMP/oligoRNAs hydrolase)